MTTSDLSTVPAHLRGTAARKRQHRLRDDSVGATASASGSTRPTPAVRVTVQNPPKRTVTCGMSAERWMLSQSLRPMSISSAFVRLIRRRHYLETS